MMTIVTEDNTHIYLCNNYPLSSSSTVANYSQERTTGSIRIGYRVIQFYRNIQSHKTYIEIMKWN